LPIWESENRARRVVNFSGLITIIVNRAHKQIIVVAIILAVNRVAGIVGNKLLLGIVIADDDFHMIRSAGAQKRNVWVVQIKTVIWSDYRPAGVDFGFDLRDGRIIYYFGAVIGKIID